MDNRTIPPDAPGSPDSFQAFVVEQVNDSIDQRVQTMSAEDLPSGDVLVRVDWSAVNFKDGMVAQPRNRVARISPLVPGVDLVGIVVESTAFRVGQPVIVHGYDLGVAHHGGFAQYARVPAGWVVPLPDGLAARHAATIGTAGFTAALSIRRLEHHGLTPESGPVLVTGASGGVGSMAVALLGSRGYQVVASTGKATEHSYLRSLGAVEVIDRGDLETEAGRALGKTRWAGAVDCVGGSTLASILRKLDYGAAVAASGLTGGNAFEGSVYPFIVRSVALLGIDSVATPIEERQSVWEELATSYPAPLLEQMVDHEVGLDELPTALAVIASGRVRGRILVRPGR